MGDKVEITTGVENQSTVETTVGIPMGMPMFVTGWDPGIERTW